MKKLFLIITLILLLISLTQVYAKNNCGVQVQSKSTQQLLLEIPSIDSKFNQCPLTLPPILKNMFKQGSILVNIDMKNGSTQSFVVKNENSEITGINLGQSSSAYVIMVNECDLDKILSTDNQIGVIAYLYEQHKITVTATAFFNKLKLWVARPF